MVAALGTGLTRRALVAGVVGAFALGTSACSGGDDGWTEVETGHLTFEHPSGWTEQEPVGGPWVQRFVGDGMELQVTGQFTDDPTASAALGTLDLPATLELPGYDGQGAVKAEVDGADTAVRSDFTWSDQGGTKQGVWIVAGQYPYPSTAAVMITGTELDESLVSHVVETMHFTKTRGE